LVQGAEVAGSPSQLQRAILNESGARKRFLFVDDDDWFSPNLVRSLEPAIAHSALIVRWAAPIFNGAWGQRLQPRLAPRLLVKAYRYARSRPLLAAIYRRSVDFLPQERDLPLVPAENILHTNNYAVTEAYLRRFNNLDFVADHTDASRLAMVCRLGIQSHPRMMLSLTNKHPCSAGVIGLAEMNTAAGESLRARVETFVRQGRSNVTPESLKWAKPAVDRTLDLFEEALG
jgi:hypothetical protein